MSCTYTISGCFRHALRPLLCLVAAPTIAAALSSCATNIIRSEAGSAKSASGVVYSLPLGQVSLAAFRRMLTAEDVEEAKKEAATTAAAATAAKKAAGAAKATLKELKETLGVAPDAGKAQLTKQAGVAEATATYLSKKSADAEKAAKDAKNLADSLQGKEGKWVETISLANMPVMPDASARYVASLNHSFTRDDDLKLVLSNGMLSSATSTSTDQTAHIILNLVQGVAGNKARMSSAGANTESPTPKKECSPYEYSTTFDPTSDVEIKMVKEALLTHTVAISFEVRSPKPNVAPLETALSEAAVTGLVYRVPRPVAIDIHSTPAKQRGCDFQSAPATQSLIVVVPDSQSAYVLPTRAGAFTTSGLSFAFKDGMLTEYSVRQPSELAALAALPLEVAKALVSIPAEILKLRVNYDNQAAALIEAKTDVLKAQIDELKAQRALDAAKEKPAATPTP